MKTFFKNEVKTTILLKRSKMQEAFSLIKSPVHNAVTYDTFSSLLKLIDRRKYNNENQVKLLYDLIDFDSSKLIGKYEHWKNIPF